MGWFPQAEGEVACCPPGAGGAAHTDEAAGWPCCGACASPAPAHSKVAIEKVTNRCLLFISFAPSTCLEPAASPGALHTRPTSAKLGASPHAISPLPGGVYR